jgi:hypothetical protein
MHAVDARFIGEHDAQMPLASRCRSNCAGHPFSWNWGVPHDENTPIEGYTRYSQQSREGLRFYLNATRAKADRVEHELRARGTPISRSSLVPLADLPQLLLAADVRLRRLAGSVRGPHACIESEKLPATGYYRVDVGDMNKLVEVLHSLNPRRHLRTRVPSSTAFTAHS